MKAQKIIGFVVLYIIVIALCLGAIYYYYDTNRIVKDISVSEADIFVSAYVPPGVDRPSDTSHKNIVKSHSDFTVKVPIFLYHYIHNPDLNDTEVVRGITVTPANFESQMKNLLSQGYNPITLEELRQAILNKTKPVKKSFILTFDDGYKDFYTQAYPILKKYNLKTTLFIITNLVGDPRYVSWSEVDEMSRSGLVEIGSHTRTHANLINLDSTNLRREVYDSKKVIEQRLGRSINYFCYPFGFYDDKVENAVKSAGYRAAVSVNKGDVHSEATLYILSRIRVGNSVKINY